jgi:hypothetical protein
VWYLRLILSQICRLVAAELEELRPGPNLYAFAWVLVVCVAMVGLLALLFFLWLRAIGKKYLLQCFLEKRAEKVLPGSKGLGK